MHSGEADDKKWMKRKVAKEGRSYLKVNLLDRKDRNMFSVLGAEADGGDSQGQIHGEI